MLASKPPVLDVLTQALGQAASLGSNLMQLAAAEIGESAGSLLKGLITIVTGVFIALIGALFLLQAGVAALVQHGWTPPMAYLAVGGGAMLLGLLALLIGALALRNASPVPHRTIREARALFEQQGTVE